MMNDDRKEKDIQSMMYPMTNVSVPGPMAPMGQQVV